MIVDALLIHMVTAQIATTNPMDRLTYIANKQRFKTKPIIGWRAYKGGVVVDENNSIAILRDRYGYSVIYKSVR